MSARLYRKSCSKAFSLVEVMIAVMVVSIMAATVVSSMVFNSRSMRLNSNRLAAKNIAQGFIERMQASDFMLVGDPANPTHLVGSPSDPRYPGSGQGFPDVSYTDNPGVYLDEALGIKCNVNTTFKGYGRATGGSASTLTDTNANWEPNEWAGDFVYLIAGTDGAGVTIGQATAGQFARIVSNTANTLTVADVAGNPQDGFFVAPNANSIYMINFGKTVEVTTSWQYLGNTYSQTMEGLIINRNNSAVLGFQGI